MEAPPAAFLAAFIKLAVAVLNEETAAAVTVGLLPEEFFLIGEGLNWETLWGLE